MLNYTASDLYRPVQALYRYANSFLDPNWLPDFVATDAPVPPPPPGDHFEAQATHLEGLLATHRVEIATLRQDKATVTRERDQALQWRDRALVGTGLSFFGTGIALAVMG